MCELPFKTPTKSDEESLPANIHNLFVVIVTNFQMGGILEGHLTGAEWAMV